jgi:hypothetical protein
MQEKLEYTKGVIRAVNRISTDKKSSKMQNGVIRGGTPKEDMQEEFEDTKGIIRGVHRRRTYQKCLKMQNK